MSHDASVEQQILATIDKWVDQELKPIARDATRLMNTPQIRADERAGALWCNHFRRIWRFGSERLDLRSNRLSYL